LRKCTKDILKGHQQVFAPFKVLSAIDTSYVGGITYNGLETLNGCEELDRYQRGLLPSRSLVQKAAYELHGVGKN
jgi:hypothetical protein